MRTNLAAVILLGAAMSFGLARPAHADAESCRDALDQEETAKIELEDARQRYNQCAEVGDEDCSTEVQALKDAQEEWQDALDNRQGECS